jgi:hypothetical protein
LQRTDREEWLEKVDDFLAQSSWNKTWSGMMSIIGTALMEIEKKESVKTNGQQYV